MAKNAVFYIDPNSILNDEHGLKKLSLLFDKIYVQKSQAKQFEDSDKETYGISDYVWNGIQRQNQTVDYLIDKKILYCYELPFQGNAENLDDERKNLLKEATSLLIKNNWKEKIDNAKTFREISQIKSERDEESAQTADLINRVNTITLSRIYDDEFIPILKSQKSFKNQGKKEKVVQFVLGNIPEPDEATAWEQIIDFRSDAEIRNKYLALINWMNEITVSPYSLSEIKEKYEYLYNDYMKHFKLHKMKYNNTLLEVLVTAGAGFLIAFQAGEFAGAFKNLLKLNLSYVNLLQEEAKLPGKELAYIHTAYRTFKP